MGILEVIGGSHSVTIGIGVLAAAASIMAAYIAYGIYRNGGLPRYMLYMTAGFILIVFHWLLEISIEGSVDAVALKGIQKLTDIVAGSLCIWGLRSMKWEADKIAKAEKRAEEKIVFMNSA